MMVWALDKIINPGHTAAVFKHFYLIPNLNSNISFAIGIFQILVCVFFLFGIQKRLSYGLVFLMHLGSTFASWKVFLSPWESPNILFWAALPMLAATYTLYLNRNNDTLLNLT
jgi:hypothetical protein